MFLSISVPKKCCFVVVAVCFPLEFVLHSHASLLLMYLILSATLSCFVNDIMGADYWAPNGSTHGVRKRNGTIT